MTQRTTDTDKVLELLAASELSNYAIAKATNISEASIGNYKRGKTKPTPANTKILLDFFTAVSSSPFSGRAADASPKVTEFVNVPIIPVRAKAGYLVGFGDPEYMERLQTIPVHTDRSFHGKYMCFEVEGDSMDDGTREALCDKDIILAREIRRDLWSYKLHYRDWNFVIVHQDGILIKRIVDHNLQNRTITCHSTNPLYGGDFTLSLDEVLELYNVIKIVDRSVKI